MPPAAPGDVDMKGKTGNWRKAAAGGRLNRDPPRRPASGRAEARASLRHGLRRLEDGVIGRKPCHQPWSNDHHRFGL